MRPLVGLALVLAVLASEATGATEIRRPTLAGGGGQAINALASIRSTLGQTVVGRSDSQSYQIGAGFWGFGGALVSTPSNLVEAGVVLGISNRPNPFPTRTAITFSVPSGAVVRLGVFDLSGRRVRSLIDGVPGISQRSVTWDGRDDAGRSVASGAYFAVLDAPGGRVRHRLLLVR